MKPALQNQTGNVLWFILFAVAMLGILTVIISRTGSSVDQTGNLEENRITAAALMRYAKSVENATLQMSTQGISEGDLDFNAIGGTYDNPDCTDPSCDVFHVEGGGLDYRPAGAVLGDASFSGNWIVSTGNRIGGMGCDDADDACRELLWLLPGISEGLCLQINSIMKITNPSEAPPRQQYVEDTVPYTGSFSDNGDNYILGGSNATNESPQIHGKGTGCVLEFGGGSDRYVFYHVLIAR